MKKTDYTDDELSEKIKHLFSVADSWNIEAAEYLKEQRGDKTYIQVWHGGMDDKYQAMKAESGQLMAQAYDLIESGQIPWIAENGLVNNCDIRGRTTEVIARRIFDTLVGESDTSGFDGRTISLTVATSGDFGSSQYSLTFRNPATVKATIEQLQQELDGWDNWNGGFHKF